MPRKSGGRQKIEIAEITKQSSSAVAFSKRHSGVFKKASELCTLCGPQIAVIVHSQNRKKVYSFGDSSVEEIVNRFLERSPGPSRSRTSQFVEVLRNANIQELYNQLTNMLAELETVKKVGAELHKIRKESQENNWWDKPIEELGLEELEQLRIAMLQLIKVAQKHAERHMA